MFQNLKKLFSNKATQAVAVVSGTTVALPSFAYTEGILDAVDWAAVATAIGTVAGALALVFVAIRGSRALLSMIRG